MFFRIFFSLSLLIFSGVASPPSMASNPAALSKDFIRAQKAELKALERRYKADMKALKTSQNTREKDWKDHETIARHKFFADHPRGSERRPYIQDFRRRKEALYQGFTDERNQKTAQYDKDLEALKLLQSLNLKEFMKALNNHETPNKKLWPKDS
jgi:hypothetical protein